MFERFTDRARFVVRRATEESAELHHRHIGTEHILLALLAADGGPAKAVLAGVGVDRARVREDIKRQLRIGFDVLGASDAEALRSIGIDLDAVRAKVEETFGPDAFEPPRVPQRRGLFGRRRPADRSRFTPRAKKVLELSLREALALKHNYIGSEHILLGLLREGNGLAAKILVDEGFDLDDLRRRTLTAIKEAA